MNKSFNSTLVRLGPDSEVAPERAEPVSIPLWFD